MNSFHFTQHVSGLFYTKGHPLVLTLGFNMDLICPVVISNHYCVAFNLLLSPVSDVNILTNHYCLSILDSVCPFYKEISICFKILTVD